MANLINKKKFRNLAKIDRLEGIKLNLKEVIASQKQE
jgi:hypothetical protein